PGDAVFQTYVSMAINGSITGAFGLIKDGGGTLSLGGGGINTYTGSTTVIAGTLELNKTSGIAIPGALNIDGPGAVVIQGSNQIASTSGITLNSVPATATLSVQRGSSTV